MLYKIIKNISLLGLILLFSCRGYQHEIKIAVVGPFSGGIAKEIMRASKIAINDINQSGGVKYKKGFAIIKPVFVDTRYLDLSIARKNLSDAIDKNSCKFIVGGFASKMVLSLMDIMAKKKIIWFGTGGASILIPELIKNNHSKYKYYFKTSLINTREQARLIAGFIKSKIIPSGLRRASIVAVSHGYAKEVINFTKKYLSTTDIRFENEFFFDPRKPDFKNILLKAKKSDFIIIAMVGDEILTFYEEAAKLKIPETMPILGPIATSLTKDILKETKGKAKHLIFLSGCLQGITLNPAILSFKARYYAQFGVFPNWMAYNTYDSILLLKDVIEKTNSIKPDKIIGLLENGNYEHSGLFNKKWHSDDHDLVTGMVNGKLYSHLAIIQYGQYGQEKCIYPPYFKTGTFYLAKKRR